MCYNYGMFDVLKEKNLISSKAEEEKLYKFLILLKEWNEKFNLTSIKNDLEIEIKHFEDSLYGAFLFSENKSVVEIGSGGGFPSMPLMIKRNDLKFTLVESVGKKCEFLKHVISTLNLNGVVLNKRAEDLGKDKVYRESFDIVTARAVASLNTLSEYTLPLIKKGGQFIAYKSVNDELCLAKNAINVLGGKFNNEYRYSLSNDCGERVIYIIDKVNPTPANYPRGNGKERSKPL
ncbi:MAG: 16S rRNA (guanine(527)-N(7))-methyltransferase RsmG [Clostridia bacterium]|nr:16S rRNA (guanine(527)-N(7))-methyltransferase RsmG [Clostridia bacterium]